MQNERRRIRSAAWLPSSWEFWRMGGRSWGGGGGAMVGDE